MAAGVRGLFFLLLAVLAAAAAKQASNLQWRVAAGGARVSAGAGRARRRRSCGRALTRKRHPGKSRCARNAAAHAALQLGAARGNAPGQTWRRPLRLPQPARARPEAAARRTPCRRRQGAREGAAAGNERAPARCYRIPSGSRRARAERARETERGDFGRKQEGRTCRSRTPAAPSTAVSHAASVAARAAAALWRRRTARETSPPPRQLRRVHACYPRGTHRHAAPAHDAQACAAATRAACAEARRRRCTGRPSSVKKGWSVYRASSR